MRHRVDTRRPASHALDDDQRAGLASGVGSLSPRYAARRRTAQPFKAPREKGTETQRYATEARWHLLEVYRALSLDEIRIIVNWVEEIGRASFLDYANHVALPAINYLGASPSQREKKTYKSPGLRLAFLAAVLFFGCLAARQLQAQHAAGQIRGGLPYREMTKQAAMEAYIVTAEKELPSVAIFPADHDYIDTLAEGDPLRSLFGKWACDIAVEF